MRTPDTQASSLQSREKEEFKDFEAGMELEGDSQSDTDSEDLRIEEALKTLNAQLTADKQGYDLFMEEILPLYEESRSHVGKPESEEYQIGFGHFLKSMEHRGDPEESGLSGWADREPPETLGHPPYSLRGRVEALEIRKDLFSCQLSNSGMRRRILPSQHCEFKLLQRDSIDLESPISDPATAVYLLQAIVCSNTCRLREATITLSLIDCEELQVVAIAKPPVGAECIKPLDASGTISFEETSYNVGHAPGRVLYVGHETSGTTSACMVDSTTALMQMLPDKASQEVDCLSGLLLVSIKADASKSTFKMAISVEASRSVSGLFKKCRKGHNDTVGITNKPFELNL